MQLYLVRPLPAGAHQAIVVSLFARTESVALHRPALDAVIARMTLDAPEGAAPDAGAARPAPSARERPAEKDGG